MNVLLDTHAFLWHVTESDHLSSAARKAIHKADQVLVHAISAWEIGMLVSKGRLALAYDVGEFISRSHGIRKIQWIPMTPDLAVKASHLPGDAQGQVHGDPADRIIAATSLSLGIPLITSDRKLRTNPHLQTIW